MWKSEQLLTVVAAASPDDCITEQRMIELTGMDARVVENCCLKLRKHGFMERTGRGCHKLTAAGRAAVEADVQLRSGPKGPHLGCKVTRGTVRERAWSAIRLLGKGSTPDVVMLAAQGGEKSIQHNIGKYFRILEAAGYLARLKQRERGTVQGSNGHIRWLLVRDTGPLSPVWRVAAGTVYDPNTGEEHKCG